MDRESKVQDTRGSGENFEDALEYVDVSVPESKRKNLISLIFVLAGYPIALSNFVIGGRVGVGLTFSDAVLALAVGNAFLIAIVILVGLLAFWTGLSTSFLSRRVFGISGSTVFSILLAISALTWVSTNADIFARMIKTTFKMWPVPIPVTAVLVVLIWMQSAIRGYKGLQFVSYIGVPAALVMALWGVAALFERQSLGELAAAVPENPITFAMATSQIIGGWIFGAVITPDVCRYAKRASHVVIAGLVAFFIGCFGLQFAGALVALATGTGDFIKAMDSLGLVYVAFVCAIFCLWTTQDNNIYGASLALQNIIESTRYKGKVKHLHLASLIAVCAAVLAALGIYSYLSPAIALLSVLFPALPGMLIAEAFFVKRPMNAIRLNPYALMAWVGGGVAGYVCLKFNFFVPPVVNMLTSGILYVALMRLNPALGNNKVAEGVQN